jgi:hypothetical protein
MLFESVERVGENRSEFAKRMNDSSAVYEVKTGEPQEQTNKER